MESQISSPNIWIYFVLYTVVSKFYASDFTYLIFFSKQSWWVYIGVWTKAKVVYICLSDTQWKLCCLVSDSVNDLVQFVSRFCYEAGKVVR